jgi:hypothetical protein
MAARPASDMLLSSARTSSYTDGATAMNLMLATLTAKDRFDAFQADADAERLAAHLPAAEARHRAPRHVFGWLTGRLHLTGRGAGA